VQRKLAEEARIKWDRTELESVASQLKGGGWDHVTFLCRSCALEAIDEIT
jgi:hypothetical protein